MQRLATLGAFAAASVAFGQNSGFARFSRTSDTIKIQGNTVFPTNDATYEAVIRLDPSAPSSPLGYVVSEEQISVEDKTLAISSDRIMQNLIRGFGCGTSNVHQLTAPLGGSWHHIATVRQGTSASLYIDGVRVETWTNQPSCTTDAASSLMAIGMMRYGSVGNPASGAIPSFLGDLDWIRISSGARYTANFTPPYECEILSDAQTQLLLKFNEPAGTTTLIDESPNHFVCNVGVPVEPGVTATAPTLGNTAGGNLACAPSQNSGFARFSATSDTIRIQGNTVFPTADFTYEMRVRIAKGASLGHVISEQRDTFEAKIVALSANNFYGAMTRGALCGAENLTPGGTSLSDGWHHIAWVRAGSVARLYLDGVLNAEWASQPNCLGNSPDSWMSIGMIRYTYQQPTLPSFLGDIDWIRVSSTARYLSAFSAPYECEITSDANTQLLLKFNEASGTTTLIDESPNHFQCNVGVAVNPGGTATAPSLGNTTGGFPACTPLCDSDIDANHITDGIDLAIILARWGTAAKDYPRADANLDGIVDGSDLSIVLNGWGPCQ